MSNKIIFLDNPFFDVDFTLLSKGPLPIILKHSFFF